MYDFFLFLLLPIISATKVNATCNKKMTPLKEGPIPGHPGLSFGKPEQMGYLQSYLCFPIISGQKTAGWLHGPRLIDGRLYGHRCIKHGTKEPEFGEQLSLIKPDINLIINLESIKMPNFGFFANPSYCETKVAYWGEKESKNGYEIIAIIYDMATKRSVFEKRVGSFPGGTDDPSFFDPPIWDTSGKSLVFPAKKIESWLNFNELKVTI